MGVKLNSGGSVIPSGTAAADKAIGLVFAAGSAAAGEVVSVLTRGEIVEFGGSVGTKYYAGTGGVVGTASTNTQLVGTTVEGDRLVVLM
jgi:hypothetical protein